MILIREAQAHEFDLIWPIFVDAYIMYKYLQGSADKLHIGGEK